MNWKIVIIIIIIIGKDTVSFPVAFVKFIVTELDMNYSGAQSVGFQVYLVVYVSLEGWLCICERKRGNFGLR